MVLEKRIQKLHFICLNMCVEQLQSFFANIFEIRCLQLRHICCLKLCFPRVDLDLFFAFDFTCLFILQKDTSLGSNKCSLELQNIRPKIVDYVELREKQHWITVSLLANKYKAWKIDWWVRKIDANVSIRPNQQSHDEKTCFVLKRTYDYVICEWTITLSGHHVTTETSDSAAVLNEKHTEQSPLLLLASSNSHSLRNILRVRQF